MKHIGVIFGGRSAEHEVSVESAKSVARNLALAGFRVSPVYVPQRGAWALVRPADLAAGRLRGPRVEPSAEKGGLMLGRRPLRLDAVFPVIHGSTGEDGALQGFLELLGLPYVGCGVLASAAGMDKALSKEIAGRRGVPLLPHVEIAGGDRARVAAGLKAARRLGLPLFVKPAQLGSSVGITKVKAWKELEKAVRFAFRYDTRVLVEKGVDRARELVCGVLGTPLEAAASVCGEVRPKGAHEFYDYEAKYLDDDGMEFLVPAPVSAKTAGRLRELAVLVFRALGCRGMARVDFLMDPRSEGRTYFCEINTIPGFTSHSLYPALWNKTGLATPKLVARLVDIALRRHREKSALKTVRL